MPQLVNFSKACLAQLIILLIASLTIITSLAWNNAFNSLVLMTTPVCTPRMKDNTCNYRKLFQTRLLVAVIATVVTVIVTVLMYAAGSASGVMGPGVGPHWPMKVLHNDTKRKLQDSGTQTGRTELISLASLKP